MSKNKKKVLLGVTGSVAAIKTLELYNLISEWAEIKVISTYAALHFIDTIPKFKIPVISDNEEWQWRKKGDTVLHIELKKWADIFLIAPLSANSLAKLSNGQCDNLLTSICRAWDFNKPILVAPAMNTFMWNHPITQTQLKILKKWGYHLIPPISKILACGDDGFGAMAEPTTINKKIKKM